MDEPAATPGVAAPSSPPRLAAPIAGGRVVAAFGPGRQPSTGVWLVRSGVRLRGRPGNPVTAVGAGVVRRVDPSPAGGLALVVNLGAGWTSILAGLSPGNLPPGLAPGARVARGDRVGRLAGAAGGAPEIVLELWRGGCRSIRCATSRCATSPDADRLGLLDRAGTIP